jgi:hypothetical protein
MALISEFGVPDYMKIDIGGNDRVCIAGLTRAVAPKYISIEMNHAQGDKDIQRRAELGYRDFKVICRNNSWHQAALRNPWFYNMGSKHFAVLPVRLLRQALARYLHGRIFGESGPWDEKHPDPGARWIMPSLSGVRWMNWIERLGTHGLGGWLDVHARR